MATGVPPHPPSHPTHTHAPLHLAYTVSCLNVQFRYQIGSASTYTYTISNGKLNGNFSQWQRAKQCMARTGFEAVTSGLQTHAALYQLSCPALSWWCILHNHFVAGGASQIPQYLVIVYTHAQLSFDTNHEKLQHVCTVIALS